MGKLDRVGRGAEGRKARLMCSGEAGKRDRVGPRGAGWGARGRGREG